MLNDAGGVWHWHKLVVMNDSITDGHWPVNWTSIDVVTEDIETIVCMEVMWIYAESDQVLQSH